MESPSVKEFRLDPVWSLTSSGLSSFVLAVGDARSAIRVACSGGNKKVGHRRHRRGARPHFWRILPNFSRLPAISVADATAKGDGGTLEGHDDTLRRAVLIGKATVRTLRVQVFRDCRSVLRCCFRRHRHFDGGHWLDWPRQRP
jgi:hypothetical protein